MRDVGVAAGLATREIWRCQALVQQTYRPAAFVLAERHQQPSTSKMSKSIAIMLMNENIAALTDKRCRTRIATDAPGKTQQRASRCSTTPSRTDSIPASIETLCPSRPGLAPNVKQRSCIQALVRGKDDGHSATDAMHHNTVGCATFNMHHLRSPPRSLASSCRRTYPQYSIPNPGCGNDLMPYEFQLQGSDKNSTRP